ncbi:hypothetical protein TSUD_265620 [Trifolium subterraneum]|uniref:F-box associated beta-propeller type 1 domain-containing protein n=1 Tax=Trifolium subterraneum TaxID=3900 RepID=A0A2Z6PBX2_TRISU|nr:hypothetical protein TSUD_265620 [Trifolium subterraneum]
MCISVSAPEFCSIDFETSLNYDPSPVSLGIDFLLPPYRSFQIKGSCRGFIFLSHHPDIFLWNPSTGFKTQLPWAPKYLYECHYGFGYDQSRDDYLVVVLSTDCEIEENPFSSHLEIFSIRDNRWKEIEGTHFPYCGGDHDNGLLFNGSIHWLSCRIDVEIYVIVAFDLVDRKLSEMPLPDYFHHEVPSDSCLGVFGEFFGLWAEEPRNGTIELWVMKEYKLNSSWTKTLVIPLSNYFNPICSTNNGNIIGKSYSSGLNGLVKYNDKGQLLEFHSFHDGRPSSAILYTESLLSLPGDNKQDCKLEE